MTEAEERLARAVETLDAHARGSHPWLSGVARRHAEELQVRLRADAMVAERELLRQGGSPERRGLR